MENLNSANVTYIIDGNNYVCEKYDVSVPTCDQLYEFLAEIDKWLEHEIERKKRRIEVYVIFDPGAKKCVFEITHAKVRVTDAEKADGKILRIPRKIKLQNASGHIVRIVSNERGNEFAILRSEGFEQIETSRFATKIPRNPKRIILTLKTSESMKVLNALITHLFKPVSMKLRLCNISRTKK